MCITKIFQLNTELNKVTGIQRVLIDIHDALKSNYKAKIVGTLQYKDINSNLKISEDDYIKLGNPLKFHNSIVIIHERRLLPFMWILTHFPWLKIKCIYIHHNEMYDNKTFSLFPKNIVAISDSGINNLIKYFKIQSSHITKIHNCVRETSSYLPRTKNLNPNNITILYPARINKCKRQIEIVKHLKNNLNPKIKILFAGTGPLYEELMDLCRGSNQFLALGFREDITSLMRECDFMMLFSELEGLPISLIEAIQTGLPVICNDVGGNTEIIKDGKNGIVVNDWETLIETLNSLPMISQEKIDRMSREGRKIYEENFTFEAFKANYINLLSGLE